MVEDIITGADALVGCMWKACSCGAYDWESCGHERSVLASTPLVEKVKLDVSVMKDISLARRITGLRGELRGSQV